MCEWRESVCVCVSSIYVLNRAYYCASLLQITPTLRDCYCHFCLSQSDLLPLLLLP